MRKWARSISYTVEFSLIATLVGAALLWWAYLITVRDAHTALGRHGTIRTLSSSSPEDDPSQRAASCDVWTALDEQQLIRLLTDSAPHNHQTASPEMHITNVL